MASHHTLHHSIGLFGFFKLALLEIAINYILLKQRLNRFRVRLAHAAHSALGVYPEKKKIIIRLLRFKLHITISIQPQQYHWLGAESEHRHYAP